MSTSWFTGIEEIPLHNYYQLHIASKLDTYPQKVDLTCGIYQTEDGKPWVLPAIKKAEKLVVENENQDHEYMAPIGLKKFTDLANRFLLGDDSKAIKEDRVLSFQSLSGTGALKVAAEFLRRCCNTNTVYLSQNGYPVHELQFEHANYANIKIYRYWDGQNKTLDFSGMLEDLEKATKGDLVVLHACAHNPTGTDPTPKQWTQIADLIERKQLIPLFDSAYQGFASGDPDKDAYAVRYFEKRGFEMICTMSFAKNFGLYGERIGNLLFIMNDKKCLKGMQSHLNTIIRAIYLNPPIHGARLVATVLANPELYREWKANIQTISSRLIGLRQELRSKLEQMNTPGSWCHITNQNGMFIYSGLTVNQCRHLVEKYHVYLPESGRIALPFLNQKNIDYVAKAISDTVKTID